MLVIAIFMGLLLPLVVNNSLIIQWATASFSSPKSGEGTITFPLTYPTKCLTVNLSWREPTHQSVQMVRYVQSWTKSNCVICCYSDCPSRHKFDIITIGY